jgi:DNA-binding beta-propeller fold protein YncE
VLSLPFLAKAEAARDGFLCPSLLSFETSMNTRPIAFLLLVGTACNSHPPSAPSTSSAAGAPASPAASETVDAPATSAARPGVRDAADHRVGPMQLAVKAFPLPGVSGRAFLDYVAYERDPSRVWLPVANTGSADVFDTQSDTFVRIDGFSSVERDIRGSKRIMGPSSVSVGDGFVYVGNRGTSEVCTVEIKGLKIGKCLKLGTPPDGVAYVASTREVWVTTPQDHSLTILAANGASLAPKTAIKLDGEPEGYSVDETRGLFFTNLEDKDRTQVVDIKTHALRATWKPSCGPSGPRGIATDGSGAFVFVACTDHVQVLDARDGALLGKVETGAGLDNLDFLPSKRFLYAAAGKAARLTIAAIDEHGQLTVVASETTAEGARNAIADSNGNAYLVDPASARLLVFTLPHSP